VTWLLHLHGILALVALYFGYRLRKALLDPPETGRQGYVRAQASVLVASITAVFATGAVLYARYREPGGVKTWLLAHAPAWHEIWFEWKEHLGFFSLVLAIGLLMAARHEPGPARTALAYPLLVTLLLTLIATTVVGTVLSFFIRAVA
jgi:hypothetical protein